MEVDARRYSIARGLFRDWVGVTTHPDLLAAMWGSLSAEDKEFWLKKADTMLLE